MTQPTTASKLVIENLTKRFPMPKGEEIVAISGVSFDVKENEVCVILGPSGCGKSTVLRMIAGLETPSSGSLKLDGRSIDRPGRDRGGPVPVRTRRSAGKRLPAGPCRQRADRCRRQRHRHAQCRGHRAGWLAAIGPHPRAVRRLQLPGPRRRRHRAARRRSGPGAAAPGPRRSRIRARVDCGSPRCGGSMLALHLAHACP